MATIDDLSDDPKYTIKSVCTKTGIRPVTLRAWERRHDILSPHRSENRYRLYSERDIAILQWVKHRVDSGIAISSAAQEMRSLIQSGVWPEVTSNFFNETTPKLVLSVEEYSNLIHDSLIKHQEGLAGEAMRDAHAAYGLHQLCTDIIVPCLQRIGEDWYEGRIGITTEHFASTYIRGRLLSLLQSLPNRRDSAHILVGCGPNETHEIGSLIVALFLREKGYRVEYLGADLPIEDLVDYAGSERPDAVILSATMPANGVLLVGVQEKLNRLRKKVRLGFGGRAFLSDPSLVNKVDGFYLGASLDEVVSSVKQLLAPR